MYPQSLLYSARLTGMIQEEYQVARAPIKQKAGQQAGQHESGMDRQVHPPRERANVQTCPKTSQPTQTRTPFWLQVRGNFRNSLGFDSRDRPHVLFSLKIPRTKPKPKGLTFVFVEIARLGINWFMLYMLDVVQTETVLGTNADWMLVPGCGNKGMVLKS